jgi:hypothetical protein
LEVLRTALNRMGLQNRFEYYEASPRCEGDFKQAFDAFYAKLEAMPKREVIVEEA